MVYFSIKYLLQALYYLEEVWVYRSFQRARAGELSGVHELQ